MKKKPDSNSVPAAAAQLGCEHVFGHCPFLEGGSIALEMTPSQIKAAAAYSGRDRKLWLEGRRQALLDVLHFINDLRANLLARHCSTLLPAFRHPFMPASK